MRRLPMPIVGEYTVWDSEVLGLGVRCLASGSKSWIVIFRAERGRGAPHRRITLGPIEALTVEAARRLALDIRARAAGGEDPTEARRAARKARSARSAPVTTLARAISAYAAALEARGVSDRDNVISALRRHLLKPLGDRPLEAIDRAALIGRIKALFDAGLPGAARSVKAKTSTFFAWCRNEGLVASNPIADYALPRATRAEVVKRARRLLSEAELAEIWRACGDERVTPAFGALVRILILTGQRRTETSMMRWDGLAPDMSAWTIAGEVAKNGASHWVPLPPLASAEIARLRGAGGCPWVFTTNHRAPISGWSKLTEPLREAAGLDADWTLHDLRRAFRSGLARIGVRDDVAEIMINHRPEPLRAVYDLDPREEPRRRAADAWAMKIEMALLKSPRGKSGSTSR